MLRPTQRRPTSSGGHGSCDRRELALDADELSYEDLEKLKTNEAIREAEFDEIRREVDGVKRSASTMGPTFNPVQTIRDELKGAVDGRLPGPVARQRGGADQQLRVGGGHDRGGTGSHRRIVVGDDDRLIGLETIAASLSESSSTVEDVYEPFLLQQGYLIRTPRGRLLIDSIMLKAPVFGPLFRKVAVAKFTRTLGTMISSGVRRVIGSSPG